MFAQRATRRSPDDRGSARPPAAAALAVALLATACVTPKQHEPAAGASPAQATPAPPAAAAKGDEDAARALREAEARREQEAAATRDHLQRLDAALADVNGKLQELDAAVRAPPRAGEPTERERALGAEVKDLRATLEQQGQRLAALDRSLAELRRAGAERAAAQGRAPPPRPPQREPAEGTGSAAPPDDKAGILALAREQERTGERTVARELYEQYAAQFPGDPSTAEAHFRLGELAFGDRRYRDAIVAYGRVAREFPQSGQAPDALLRTAESMLRLDMKDDAAAILTQIPERYPGTPAATQAKKQLAKLPASTGKPPP